MMSYRNLNVTSVILSTVRECPNRLRIKCIWFQYISQLAAISGVDLSLMTWTRVRLESHI